ncbi:MAG: NAD-dependent epimerase/dehydratase family protein [Dyella sp.]|uniref:NAD-dependent epimerase/dehydratase family protein n=1 Tax=Dyella sp. TaxID=1869338 RepID=UPI003F7DCF58
MGNIVLITGGAGFIGSHLADQLLEQGHHVRILDCLTAQVHGEARDRPAYLSPSVELIRGDIRDPAVVNRAIAGVHGVYHLAASVGVGQSMYQIADYTSVNNLGTAVLMEALSAHPVERLVVASSMSIYGEGLYRDADGQQVPGRRRSRAQLAQAQWELHDDAGRPLEPIATHEDKLPDLSSVYALSKFDQERLCLLVGEAYGIPTTALRFFNVYGPRQALSNPYTGVLAIFASRLLNGNQPAIFEDGQQRRDFVNVHDVARACRLAYDSTAAAGQVFNIGSGHAYSIAEIAERIGRAMEMEVSPEITGRYRVGDIRHCFADIGRATEVLGFTPQVAIEDGLVELADWLPTAAAVDHTQEATQELRRRGLTI